MKLFNFLDKEPRFPDIIKLSIEYLIKEHKNLDFGVLVLPDSGIKVVKLCYEVSDIEGDSIYELHRDVYDVHFIYSGDERISIVQKEEAKLYKDYDPELDVALYRSSFFRGLTLNRFDIALLAPEELHSTGVKNLSCKVVKYVLKIPSSKMTIY